MVKEVPAPAKVCFVKFLTFAKFVRTGITVLLGLCKAGSARSHLPRPRAASCSSTCASLAFKSCGHS